MGEGDAPTKAGARGGGGGQRHVALWSDRVQTQEGRRTREREEQRANEGGTGHGVGVTPHGGHGSERYQPDSIKYSVPNT